MNDKSFRIGNGSGGLASFDANPEKSSDIKFPSHPEVFQLEPHGPRILVNLPKVNLPKSFDIDVIDWSRQIDLSQTQPTNGDSRSPSIPLLTMKEHWPDVRGKLFGR